MMKRFKDSKDTGIQLVLDDNGNDENDEVIKLLIDVQTASHLPCSIMKLNVDL